MPKSKRDKKISLTRTKKRPLELKQSLIQEVRDNVEKYARVFVISTENMRNSKLKDIRQDWKNSRFFFGKNKVMMLALGKTEAEEHQKNLHLVSNQLHGQRGLLFTNQQKDEVLKWFDKYSEPDFARSGNVATETVTLDKGDYPSLHFSLEPQLRQLGLPTSLKKGVITLVSDYKLCKEGDALTPEQARILKHLGKMMVDFRVGVICMWSNDGSFEVIDSNATGTKDSSNNDEDDLMESASDVE